VTIYKCACTMGARTIKISFGMKNNEKYNSNSHTFE